MRRKLFIKAGLLGLALNGWIAIGAFAQALPLVYTAENTGSACPTPTVPTLDQAKAYAMLPDPFTMADGTTKVTKFSQWECRRKEMQAQFEAIEIGLKPPKPKSVTATFSGGTLTVTVTGPNDKTLTLTTKITLPSGNGPFPAIIGFDTPTGSLPAATFTSRNIATLTFSTSQVSPDGTRSATNPFNVLYPELLANGQYSEYSWGVSRLIDGLELTAEQTHIDTKHLAVTGCSRWGKGSLFASAMDERIALTIPQEAGGGGFASWRVSETIGKVENLGATDHHWFMESMFKWAGANTAKLPHDHHFLLAMIAPRAVLVVANGPTSYLWLAEESGYVSLRAAQDVYKAMGIPERIGFVQEDHSHCAFPTGEQKYLDAFVDKFLLGKEAVTTGIEVNPFAKTDYDKWIAAWKGKSITADATGLEATAIAKTGLRCFVNFSTSEITFEAKGAFSYEVMNHLGQSMESGRAVDRASLNKSFPKGMYFVKVAQNNKSNLMKFINN